MLCPLDSCLGRLTFYKDENAGGAWAYCNKCKFAGDTIEFAAAFWKLDLLTAIKKLQASGADMPVDRIMSDPLMRYFKAHTDKRKRMWRFWQNARMRLLIDDNINLRALQRKLNIRLNLDKDRWLNGPGLFIGGSTKQEADKCYTPDAIVHPDDITGDIRIFAGGWKETLVIPFSDLPGRIKGFLFYGKDGRIPEDIVFGLNRYNSAYVFDSHTSKGRSLDIDCGLALYESINYATDTLFVMCDPLLAIQMQCWHLQDNTKPAPVVSVYKAEIFRTETSVWRHLNIPLIFWGAPTAELFRHAKATDSLVSTVGFTATGPIKDFGSTSLSEWLPRVKKEARSWEAVFEAVLHTLPTTQAEALLMGMGLQPAEIKQIISKCPEALQMQLAPCLKYSDTRSIVIKNVPIVESNRGWRTTLNQLVCNAILRIEQIIYIEKTEEIYYRGHILLKHREVRFFELDTVVEKNTFRWMRKHLLKKGADFFEFNLNWELQATHIAKLFLQPEVIRCLTTIGWNESNACFVFPEYLITSTGEVVDNPSIKGVRERAPAYVLDRPAQLTIEDIASFPSGRGTSAFWAMAACVASNILAPVFNLLPSGIFLVGESAEITGRAAAKQLGCMEYEVLDVNDDKLKEACLEHNWPLLLKVKKTFSTELAEWLIHKELKNVILPINWYAAKVLEIEDGWHFIETSSFVETAVLSNTVRKIIPSFIQYVTKQHFVLPKGFKRKDGVAFAHLVLVWLSQWFSDAGGNYKSVINATNVANFDGAKKRGETAALAFIDILCRFFNDGKLDLERAGFIPPDKAIRALISFPSKSGGIGKIFAPIAIINRLLIKHNAPVIDMSQLDEELNAADIAIKHDYAGLSGWLIDETVWNKRLAQMHAWRKYAIRIK